MLCSSAPRSLARAAARVGTLFVLPLLVDHPSLPAVFTVITSFRVVERNIPGICCLVLVLYAVRVAGLVCCVVGYFPAVVVSHIVVACAYKDLMVGLG